MTIRVSISAEAEAKLREKAAAVGQDMADYAAGVLERLAEKADSLHEISGPLSDEFKASGMTDDQLGSLLERAKHEMRAEHRGQPRS
ncbi:MAG: hypothetical protein HOP29_01170 [Phycisphaerales bacterium]|nr:hypothetical protein [Phycisphaerales bacterium]